MSLHLQFYDPPVLCVFNPQIPHTAQHIFAHVREYQSPASEPLALVYQRPVLSQNLNSDVLMMKPAEDWYCCEAADLLRPPKIWRFFIRKMRPDLFVNRKRNFSERDATALRRTRPGDRDFRAESIQ